MHCPFLVWDITPQCLYLLPSQSLLQSRNCREIFSPDFPLISWDPPRTIFLKLCAPQIWFFFSSSSSRGWNFCSHFIPLIYVGCISTALFTTNHAGYLDSMPFWLSKSFAHSLVQSMLTLVLGSNMDFWHVLYSNVHLALPLGIQWCKEMGYKYCLFRNWAEISFVGYQKMLYFLFPFILLPH